MSSLTQADVNIAVLAAETKEEFFSLCIFFLELFCFPSKKKKKLPHLQQLNPGFLIFNFLSLQPKVNLTQITQHSRYLLPAGITADTLLGSPTVLGTRDD